MRETWGAGRSAGQPLEVSMPQVFTAFDHLYEVLATLVVVAVCSLALVARETRLKMAGVVQLADFAGVALLASLIDPEDNLNLMDYRAGAVFFAYCLMVLKWPDRWIVLLGGLQGFAILLRLSDTVGADVPQSVSGLLLNATGWAMIAVLASVVAVDLLNRRSNRSRQGLARSDA